MNIKQLNTNYSNYMNQNVSVNGWVQTTRNQKEFSFIKLNDGSTPLSVQLVFDNKIFDIGKITIGVSLNVKGLLVKSEGAGQSFEIQVNELNVYGLAEPEKYPLAKGKLPLVYLRSYSHLRFRTNTFGSVFRIKDAITYATHIFFHDNNYLHLDPNILTINECEGGAGVFQVTENDISKIKTPHDWTKDHFGKPVYLTVSSQLQLEAISCSLGAVYTTNKSFRSEHSNTNKHLSEFMHLEIENTFIDLEDLMNIGEKYIKFIGNYLLTNSLDDLKNLDVFISKGIIDRINELVNTTFIRIDYSDAINIIKNNSNIDIKFGDDLSSESENFLTEFHNNQPIFVKNWPCAIKSFYMKQNEDNLTCANFDLLMPYKVGELIGGSMREDNLDKLMNMMNMKGVSPEPLSFYLDLRRFGTVPHGGFGLGLDRLCMFFTKIENIKDVVPFPNYYQNCNY
jgi:asparaginyl-tRNA synthetase